MVDKNLFLHDLAVVAILKNEGHYLKEWLDYHLLAGVDHFYLYDNESPDNQAEIAKPYVEAGLVDYFPTPGKMMHMVICNDTVKKFKFHCRYMAFIDGDEFVYPKANQVYGGGIIELLDEILSNYPNAAGLAINWQCFGSNGQEKADYSRGVLERFTRRAPKNCLIPLLEGHPGLNAQVKTIADPRKINFWYIPHYPAYFEGFYSVNENGGIVHSFNRPVTVEKIALNHYRCMSREEYFKRVTRGDASKPDSSRYTEEMFKKTDINDEFDDGILKYRAARAENFTLKSNAERINRVTEALTETLSAYASGKKFSIETALTCRALSTYLREKFPHDAEYWKICEEASLSAILKSLNGMNMVEAMIFIRELPNILSLPYPGVAEINRAALQIISQIKDFYRLNNKWKDFTELDYIQEILRGAFFDGRKNF